MRCVTLLYHDVVGENDWESSGFTGPGTTRYKLRRDEFERHLAALASARASGPVLASEIPYNSFPFLLTFDDGGESAYSCIAELLDGLQWKGHFFITAGRIGTKGFVNAEQIRSMRARGHVIGSHSFSHPTRMANCTTSELNKEWTKSVGMLSEILGESVNTASVPGGFYSRHVAETASAAGVRVLFNSEPTIRLRQVDGCRVVGRFGILQGLPPSTSAALVSRHSRCRSQQWLYWNFKKLLKRAGGRYWIAARERILQKG